MALRPRSGLGLFAVLAALWLGSFVFYELFVPYVVARRCSWAKFPGQEQTNILLVADPQLIDNHTYPGRGEWLLDVSKHTVDVYLKQNYHAMMRQLQPDYVFFLGDLLDNGRSSQDAYFDAEVRRFESIFGMSPRYVAGKNVFYNVPGNHDIGFGGMVKPYSRTRFAEHFGTPNTVKHINGVDFIMLDTPSLSSPDAEVHGDARELMESLKEPEAPRVLLSHVPLYRDTSVLPCGPLRESSRFVQGAGYQYQSALTPELSEEVLTRIQPQLLFSGDDHDYCDVQHTEHAREITVKSISMAMGIKYPAVQLLSYPAPTSSSLVYDTHMCYLPQPYVDVFAYVALAVVSGVSLLVWSILQRASRYNYSLIPMWEADESNTIFMSNGRKVVAMNDSVLTPTPAPSTSDNLSYVTGVIVNRTVAIARTGMKYAAFTIRKWNLSSFFRNCIILGAVVVTMYKCTLYFI